MVIWLLSRIQKGSSSNLLGTSTNVIDNWRRLHNRAAAASPVQRRDTQVATMAALELCGIADLAPLQAGTLSTGRRRLVELAARRSVF